MVNKKYLVAITLAILMLVMGCVSLFSCGKKVENFELSFNVDGENYATITTTGTETIQIPENPSKDGYTFDGWYWDKDVWSKPFIANSLLDAPISSDMSVYAKFTPIAYSISYEMDGGTHNNPATYTIDSSFEFANAQKAGYTFLGWYTDATYTTQIKSISAGTTGDMTLYAKFELATYSITYENTKGAENTNPSTYTINSETITFAPLSKDGYTFVGWYVGDTKVMEISSGSTGNFTLTAKWEFIEYTATFKDGDTIVDTVEFTIETDSITEPAVPKHTGYTGVWESYILGHENITIYAVYTISAFTISDATNTNIRETDTITPELLGITASNTCGEKGIVIISVKTGVQTAGTTMKVTASVTDAEGNVYARDFELKVYGTPNIVLNQDNRIIYEDTDISTLFTAYDSFDNELGVEMLVSDELIAGKTVVVTVTAIDNFNNTVTKQYAFGILPSEKPFVELYVNDDLWQAIFVDDADNYSLPMPDLKNGFASFWFDENGEIYSNSDGAVLKELPKSVQLYYGEYKLGYEPIYTAAQLAMVSTNDPSAKYCLAINLNLNGAEWTPIGTQTAPFTGEFDGNGHVISNYKITNFFKYTGLFGYNGGTIKNLGATSFTVSNEGPSNVDAYAGGLVGYNSSGGTIKNCYSNGTVVTCSSYHATSYAGVLVAYNDEGEIIDCYAEGKVSSGSDEQYAYAGGLVGYNYNGELTNCYAMSSVISFSSELSYDDTENYAYAGGLVGYNYKGEINHCNAMGDIESDSRGGDGISCAGGLVGCNDEGVVTNCYATGAVVSRSSYPISGASSQESYAGGLVGYNRNGGEIGNCYSIGSVTSLGTYQSIISSKPNKKLYAYAGGLVGYSQVGKIINCYAKGTIYSGSHFKISYIYGGGLVGYSQGDIIQNCYSTGSVTSYGGGIHDTCYTRSGGLIGYSSGNIMDCYATGFVTSESWASTYNYAYAGGLVCSTNDNTMITNSYRYDEQSFIVIYHAHTTYEATNTEGIEANMSTLQSVTFQISTLGWDTEVWNFVEGEYPTLKDVGALN